MRLVQITDPHIGARWSAADPLNTLRTVLAAVRALPDTVDGVIVTGDLAADGDDEQYDALAPALTELGLPFWVLPGNHDDRPALRRHFPLPGFGEEAIQYEAAVGGLRVLLLDTTVPGKPHGALGPERLRWVAESLSEDRESPTLLAMHHPPFHCGVRDMDGIGLVDEDRAALEAIVSEHPQVVGCVAGHHHRTIAAAFAGRPAVVAPGTYGQLPLDFAAERLEMADEPLGFAVHTLVDGRLVSHVQVLAVTAAG